VRAGWLHGQPLCPVQPVRHVRRRQLPAGDLR
jgi:hypothetical protein